MKLYEIPTEIQKLLDAIDPETGEISEVNAAQLDALEMEFDRKAEGIAMAIRTVLAEAEVLQAEAELFARRARARARAAANMKAYLIQQMERLNKTKAGGDKLTVAIQPTATHLKVVNRQQVHEEARNAMVVAATCASVPKTKLEERQADGTAWSCFAGPWRVTAEISASRAKEFDDIPEGCALEPGKAVFIRPTTGGRK